MSSIKILVLAVTTSAFVLAGCGGGGESGGASESDAATAEQAPTGSATVAGSIQFTGTAQERQELNLDRECMGLRDEPALSQRVVVNDNGTLRWVFVYVKEGLGDQQFAPSQEPVILDQQGCMYSPHVFGVQAGQTLRIHNSDPMLHNIHALPNENRPFNFGMPTAGQQRDEAFRVPEIMVRIKCDVHPWMEAWAGVTEHPFFSTSDESGGYSIDNLPAGDYVIEAWHEEYGTQTQNVSVGDGESVSLDFTFEGGAAAS
ncbi:MAG: carboxypeptidase regulatory-like domain-containing protein [Rhodothermales bacterium]